MECVYSCGVDWMPKSIHCSNRRRYFQFISSFDVRRRNKWSWNSTGIDRHDSFGSFIKMAIRDSSLMFVIFHLHLIGRKIGTNLILLSLLQFPIWSVTSQSYMCVCLFNIMATSRSRTAWYRFQTVKCLQLASLFLWIFYPAISLRAQHRAHSVHAMSMSSITIAQWNRNRKLSTANICMWFMYVYDVRHQRRWWWWWSKHKLAKSISHNSIASYSRIDEYD